MPRFVLGLGTGRSGTQSLAYLLNQQPRTRVTHECLPLLPYTNKPTAEVVEARLQRLLRNARREKATGDDQRREFIGDVASFYLSYARPILESPNAIAMICLQRPREEVIESFCRWLDATRNYRVDHWSKDLTGNNFRDPVWSTIFPRFTAHNRKDAIGKYWDWYTERTDALCSQYPDRFRVFSMSEILNSETQQREMLRFAGYQDSQMQCQTPFHTHKSASKTLAPAELVGQETAVPAVDRARCFLIVMNHERCSSANHKVLDELADLGYTIRRPSRPILLDEPHRGYRLSAQATGALRAGCYATLWIEAGTDFTVGDVERIRESNALASFPAETSGGTRKSASLHLTWIHRRMYESLQFTLGLPLCQDEDANAVVPYFRATVANVGDERSFLCEVSHFRRQVEMLLANAPNL